MLISLTICGSIVVGVVVAMLVGFFSEFDGALSALVGVFAALITLITAGTVIDSRGQSRKEKIESNARKSCAPYRVQLFDDTKQEKVIYACSNDQKLRAVSYKDE